ncbi:MAG: hypothetical protein WCG83_04180 [Candidatus Peregrinibacteria bacterium]
MRKYRFPSWLIGGLIGVLYFLVTFGFEFVFLCDWKFESMCGFMAAIANLPATMIMNYCISLFPLLLAQANGLQILLMMVLDFLLGSFFIGIVLLRWVFGRK